MRPNHTAAAVASAAYQRGAILAKIMEEPSNGSHADGAAALV